SWYGPNFHGRAAASGETYNMEALVAAHPTLPFNTWVRVVNLANNKAIAVRIMDRGPYVDGRIIDLSHAAARAIGMIAPGTVPGRVEVMHGPPASPAGAFAVQIGAFLNRETADRQVAEMQRQYGAAKVVVREGDPVMYRVWVGAA